MSELRAHPTANGEYWVVVHTDTGRIVAQGSQELCCKVAERGSWTITRQLDLFDHEEPRN
jgi:hypothetical protein